METQAHTEEQRHSLSPVRAVLLASGVLLVLFSLAHLVAGSVYAAWPFDAKLHWVAWLGPVLLPIHLIAVSIQRYTARKRHIERGHSGKLSTGGKNRWASGVLIIVLVAVHIATGNVAAGALLLLAVGWHFYFACGCMLMDVPIDKERRREFRIGTVIVTVLLLAFFLWAHLQT